MEKLFVLFIIAAIVCALFAYKIDVVVKGDIRVKRIMIVFSVCVLLMSIILIVLALVGGDKKSIGNVSTAIFEAEILEIHDSYYLVKPVEESQELKSADQIEVSIGNLELSLKPTTGDRIKVEYDGEIAESYPAQITKVYDIEIVKKAKKQMK